VLHARRPAGLVRRIERGMTDVRDCQSVLLIVEGLFRAAAELVRTKATDRRLPERIRQFYAECLEYCHPRDQGGDQTPYRDFRYWCKANERHNDPTFLETAVHFAEAVKAVLWPRDRKPRLVLRTSGIKDAELQDLLQRWPEIRKALRAMPMPDSTAVERGLRQEFSRAAAFADMSPEAQATALLHPTPTVSAHPSQATELPVGSTALTGSRASRTPKRSTERGEGRDKLIAALTKHHKYADGGCPNLEPIGNNELARAAGVSPSTASLFFNKKFRGHTKYKALCRDAGRLTAALKLLNDEFAPYHLLGTASSNLAATEEESTDEA
jgi:hypothetical protein